MKCSYSEIECIGVNTSGETKIDCEKCKFYNQGVKPTGATPVLAWLIEKVKKFILIVGCLLTLPFILFCIFLITWYEDDYDLDCIN